MIAIRFGLGRVLGSGVDGQQVEAGGSPMSGVSCFKEPQACSEAERQEFERLVRQGFDGSDERLGGRIRAARRLAFCFSAEGPLVAIAALKAPSGLDSRRSLREGERRRECGEL